MIVISDTTAITSLIKIERTERLPQLFEEVVIPTAVEAELLRYHASLPDFLRVTPAQDQAYVKALLEDLDPGEAEAIALAVEIKPDVLLIDEKRGRVVAESKGLLCLGLIGLLLLAKEHSLMSPENPYEVSKEGSGLIFTYTKNIIDCLDNAKPRGKI